MRHWRVITEAQGSGGCMKSKGGGFLSCELCLLPFSNHGDKILRHTHSEPVCLETSHRHTGGSSFWVGKYESVSCAQSCPTLCDSMDCSPPGSSVHGGSPGKNTGVGCPSLLQDIFLTQGVNPSLPHCRQILYHLIP